MKRRVLLPLSLAPLALPAAAQVTYDAGEAGNPPTAPSPTTQGWSESVTGGCTVADVSPDPDFPLNAWELRDPGSGRIEYFDQYEIHDTYECELVMRPIAERVWIDLVAGTFLTDNQFQIELRLVGNDVDVYGNGGFVGTCPNAVGAYHSYRIVSGYAWDYAYVFYDDVLLGSIPYWIPDPLDTPGMLWGTLGTPAGRARVHYAHFGPLQAHPLGENYCGPAVPHSGGVAGRMGAVGKPFAYMNDVRLDAVDLPANRFGYFLVSETQGFVANPGGSQGNLCLGGNIGRYAKNVLNTGPNGTMSLQIDLKNVPTAPPSVVQPGETWSFQAWFRDVNPTPTSNFTDGLAIGFL